MELEKLNNPHHPAFYMILAPHIVFVTKKINNPWGCVFLFYLP